MPWYLVSVSTMLVAPLTFSTLILPSCTISCNHKNFTRKCRIYPRLLVATKDFATDDPFEMHPNARVAPSYIAMSSASPLDVARVGCVDDHVRMTCLPTFNTPPLVDFLVSLFPAHSLSTSAVISCVSSSSCHAHKNLIFPPTFQEPASIFMKSPALGFAMFLQTSSGEPQASRTPCTPPSATPSLAAFVLSSMPTYSCCKSKYRGSPRQVNPSQVSSTTRPSMSIFQRFQHPIQVLVVSWTNAIGTDFHRLNPWFLSNAGWCSSHAWAAGRHRYNQ